MNYNNYKQYYAVKNKMKAKIARNYPDIKPHSGIYIFYRPVAYIGKSSGQDGILGRVAEHCIRHDQHIDNSIHARGLTCDGGQWRIKALCYCGRDEVDEAERRLIAEYLADGYELLNIESGGTAGKEDITKRAERGGYNKGKAYGYNKAIKEVAALFEKYLVAAAKKDNAIGARKLNEFYKMLDKIKQADI